MSNNRRSVSSIIFVHVRSLLQEVSYSPDEEIDLDVTCRIIAAIFSSFLRSELYSPLASSVSKWSLITGADLRLLLVIRRVTASWETAEAWFFGTKSWKITQKYIKICSGNPKFFRSITWNPVYLSSISWHYPFKLGSHLQLLSNISAKLTLSWVLTLTYMALIRCPPPPPLYSSPAGNTHSTVPTPVPPPPP